MAGIPEVNPEYVLVVAPTCNAGTAASAYTRTTVPIVTSMLWRLEIRVPPGHCGTTGIALWDSGTWILPYASPSPSWIIDDDAELEYPYNAQVGTTVQLATYNTGTFNHTWQCRFIYTPMTALVTEADAITVPEVGPWLAQVDGAGT